MLKPIVFFFCLVFPFLAAAEDFVAGQDYEVLSAESPKGNTDKISVIEFFSYGCPWCFRIEPALMNWVKEKGKRVEFSRVPVIFNDDWSYYAKAFYTAQKLELESKLTPLLYKEIQEKGKHALNTNQAMIDFFIAQGVDPTTAKSAFENSTVIKMEVNQGMTLAAQYKVTGVPAVVVNHQYKTDLQKAKGPERFLKVLDFLIEKSANKSG